MTILDEWVNPQYLDDEYVETIRESVIAKPIAKYTVLDNFFREEKLDEMIRQHATLPFSEQNDKVTVNGELLPYDSSVVFAQRGEHFGSELFYDEEWQQYCCYIAGVELSPPFGTEIKLRCHKADADGFWVHTDSTIRSLVVIGYFNRRWQAKDGGLLQLWKVEDEYGATPEFNTPKGRLDFLEKYNRIRTSTPGGGFEDGRTHDLILVDQIVPAYNRIFLCNFQYSPTYHSVTPSHGRERLGFVQWLFDREVRK